MMQSVTPDSETRIERDKRLGRGGLFTAITLSVAAAVVGTGELGDFYVGISIGAALTLIPAAILAFNRKTRTFASGMLAGVVLALGMEVLLLLVFVVAL